MTFILTPKTNLESFVKEGGGKAFHLAKLTQQGYSVPEWFCIGASAFDLFLEHNRSLIPTDFRKAPFEEIETLFLKASMPGSIQDAVSTALEMQDLKTHFIAVRSSGLDEDSLENSFAGQYSTFLYQKGLDQVLESIKKCWASGYTERSMAYRKERKIQAFPIRMGVVIQKMIASEISGVAFSRNPVHPLDRDSIIITSVWGLGEGLVSGELDADHFEVNRKTFAVSHSLIAQKPKALRYVPGLGKVASVSLDLADHLRPSLSETQTQDLARMVYEIEVWMGEPQDIEWTIDHDQTYLLQTRPITNLPRNAFFDPTINGGPIILWDNSNIIESYSGVTSPLTFSFASRAYTQVYIQFCEVMGLPKELIASYQNVFENMLGIVRGHIFYNLIHWYKLVLLLPGASQNKRFMETMMGVKQEVKPGNIDLKDSFTTIRKAIGEPYQYSVSKKMVLVFTTFARFLKIDSIVKKFMRDFNKIYESTRKLPFYQMSVEDLTKTYRTLESEVLKKWHAPIINDYLCMIFFGVLKKLTEKWVSEKSSEKSNVQNDLLCGEGNLDSTAPTKALMQIASDLDQFYLKTAQWILESPAETVWNELQRGYDNSLFVKLNAFLDLYGFRCINELKLEEPDLHDNPTFIIEAIKGYLRTKSYSVAHFEAQEREIRNKAEAQIRQTLFGFKRWIYYFSLKQARKAIRNRENLRFARTKIFGIARHLFRGLGNRFQSLGMIENEKDIFYLTIDEIFGTIEGRSLTSNLSGLIQLRKDEYSLYQKAQPPERFITHGVASLSFRYPAVLSDTDCLAAQAQADALKSGRDPNKLYGTPCSPGVVEATVRVVSSIEDAKGLNSEILVTARTDPGWVPLYPSCSGLLIERGSLLSHSAVVARELGIPTIVSISGGLMSKLKTGQRVRMDAGKGEVTLL